jgi:hypothetical protein
VGRAADDDEKLLLEVLAEQLKEQVVAEVVEGPREEE